MQKWISTPIDNNSTSDAVKQLPNDGTINNIYRFKLGDETVNEAPWISEHSLRAPTNSGNCPGNIPVLKYMK